MYDDEDKKDDGSVWTSYSDLFTTVAVIFLVMFVFALIKASVTKMQAVVEKRDHESELKGKVSESVKKQTDKKIGKVTQSISEIGEYENLIDQKMKEMSQFVKKLKSSKTVMKDLIKDQERKEAQLKSVSQKLQKLEENLNKERKVTKTLETRIKSKIEKISKVINENEQIKAEKIQLDKLVETKKNEIQQKELQNKDLSKKLDEKSEKLEQKLNEEQKLQTNLEETVSKLVNQKITNENLTAELAEQVKVKTQTEKSFNEHVAKTIKLKQELTSSIAKLKENINQKKSIIQKKSQVIEKNKREIASFEDEVKVLKTSQQKRVAKLEETKTLLSKTTQLKELQQKQIADLIQFKSELEQKNIDLEKKLISEADSVKKLSKELTSYKKQISEQKTENASSLKKIAGLTKSLNLQKSERAKVFSQLQEANRKVAGLSKVAGTQKLEIQSGKQRQENLQQQIAKAEKSIGELQGQIKQEQMNGGKLAKNNSSLKTKNKGLHKKTLDLSDALEKALKELGQVKEQNIALGVENNKFLDFKKELTAKMENLRGQMHGLRGENKRLLDNWNELNDQKIARENIIANMKQTKADLMKRLALLEGRLNKKAGMSKKEALALQKEIDALKGKNNNLKDTLQDFAQKVVDVKDKLRNSIAKRLAKEFRKADINVHVDEKTGNVVLLMNENFRFKKNSFRLNASARNTLKKIIPIYSEVLFGNDQVKQSIQSFNVVGHASPNHKGNYVEPLAHNNKAYSYNMRLSAQRAASVTNYIFGKRIGTYHYKRFLKSFTSAIGQGYTKPVRALKKLKNGRGLASVKESNCGPYDCYASQRVELSFTLKDDVESLNKIINMAKSVK